MLKRLGLWVQHVFAQVFIPFTFATAFLMMKGVMGYRWENLGEFRKKIRLIVGINPRPLIVCPNHLTMIDSLVLAWAMTPFWRALKTPGMFPWNTPEKTNYSHNPFLRFFTYIGKCLPVIRQGPREKTNLFMYKIGLLLKWGQSLMMFPEGARSLTGRVDSTNYAYGVGKIIDTVRQEGLNPRVLLVYLRGRGQKGKSTIPRRREVFYMDAQLVDPQSESSGMRASRDISSQIIKGLVSMENLYFAR